MENLKAFPFFRFLFGFNEQNVQTVNLKFINGRVFFLLYNMKLNSFWFFISLKALKVYMLSVLNFIATV